MTSIHIPDTVYASGEDTVGVGTEGVGVGGSSAGSFSYTRTGYRMYFIDKNGTRVSNIVDVCMTDPYIKMSSSDVFTYNTRFESYSDKKSAGYMQTLASELVIEDNIPMGNPIIYNSAKEHYESQGEEFRQWMMAGEVMLVGGGGSGGVSTGSTYVPKQPTSKRPSPSKGGGTDDGPGAGETDMDISDSWGNYQRSVDDLYTIAWNTINSLHATGAVTRDKAIARALEDVSAKIIEYIQLFGDSHPDCAKVYGAAAKAIESELNLKVTYKGWADKPVGKESTQNTGLFSSLIDIAYADGAGQGNNGKGHITDLLNGNDLFIFRDLTEIKQASGKTDAVAMMIEYELYLIVEPIYWFVPAGTKLDTKDEDEDGSREDYVIGDQCNKWFYGTVVSYGMWATAVKAEGKFNDGGKGGWYKHALNTTGAQALVIDAPLLDLVAEFNGNTDARSNQYLANMAREDGYALHYYYGEGGDFPEIPTYDITTINPNEDPHPVQNPDTIEVVKGEFKESGTSLLDYEAGSVGEEEFEEGYRNHSRTTTIVKVYSKMEVCSSDDPDCVGINGDGEYYKYIHEGTYVTYDTPGTISIQHEPDYKVKQWLTTEDSIYGSFDLVSTSGAEAINSYSWDAVKSTLLGRGAILSREEEYEWSAISELPAGTEASEVVMGLAADPDYDDTDESAGEPELGYYERTLYIHLVSKSTPLKTHTLDRTISPGPAPDPNAAHEGGPLTPEEKKQCNYNIVKVYETLVVSDGGSNLTLSGVFVRRNTAGIIKIEEEAGLPARYDLQDWFWTDDDEPIISGENWNDIRSKAGAELGSGAGIAEVDIRDTSNLENTRTLYVHYYREVTAPGGSARLDIEQSQIGKAIHTNAGAYGDPTKDDPDAYTWGKEGAEKQYFFKFALDPYNKYGSFKYWEDHGCCRNEGDPRCYDSYRVDVYKDTDGDGINDTYWYYYNVYTHNGACGNKCVDGHTSDCEYEMPGLKPDGDNEIQFTFGQTETDEMQILGVNGFGPSVYKYSTYPKDGPQKLGNEVFEEKLEWDFHSDGEEDLGFELVTVIWRGFKGEDGKTLEDIPTLAQYKKVDIIKHLGGESHWWLPYYLLTENEEHMSRVGKVPAGDRKENGNRVFEFKMDFGAGGDITATASCKETHESIIGPTMVSCEAPTGKHGLTDAIRLRLEDDEKVRWIYTFEAYEVLVKIYKGESKGLAALPFGGTMSTPMVETTGPNKVLYKTQGTNVITFYPYIRMTYMTSALKPAIKEERNQTVCMEDCRDDTYILSEYESSILPTEAIEIGWSKTIDENLVLNSPQWSLHERAVSGSAEWNGRNQVLPGGALYQLSTPSDKLTTVHLTTYQTLIVHPNGGYEGIDASREPYILSGAGEYSTYNVAKTHTDVVNNAKEVLDNLNIVQWVNKLSDGPLAWNGSSAVKLTGVGGQSLSRLGLTNTTQSDDKYYFKTIDNSVAIAYGGEELRTITKDKVVSNNEAASDADLDIMRVTNQIDVFKVFTDTSGNVYGIMVSSPSGLDNESVIRGLVASLKEINADSMYDDEYRGIGIYKLCGRNVGDGSIQAILESRNIQAISSYNEVNKIDVSDGLADINKKTSFITNIMASLNRNMGSDRTASWSASDGAWYNEAFDGMYLVRQHATLSIGLQYSSTRVNALDPALCPVNVGQSDLYTKAFRSQFRLDEKSVATIAIGKAIGYLGTFKEGTNGEVDIILPNMTEMYKSKKFYIPNANVQDLN